MLGEGLNRVPNQIDELPVKKALFEDELVAFLADFGAGSDQWVGLVGNPVLEEIAVGLVEFSRGLSVILRRACHLIEFCDLIFHDF